MIGLVFNPKFQSSNYVSIGNSVLCLDGVNHNRWPAFFNKYIIFVFKPANDAGLVLLLFAFFNVSNDKKFSFV